MISVECIRTVSELMRLKDVWQEVLSYSDVDHPFLTFDWIVCWWHAFSAGNTLYVLVARDRGVVVGIAPLMQTTVRYRGVRCAAVTFIANYHSNRSGFILPSNQESVAVAFMEFMKNDQIKHGLFIFDLVPCDSSTERSLTTALTTSMSHYVVRPSLASPYVQVGESWEKYYEKRSSRSMRRSIRKLEHEGLSEVCVYHDRNIAAGWAELLQVSKKTWQYDAGTAIASCEETVRFYFTLTAMAAEQGWLQLVILKSNGHPIAFTLDLVYCNRAYLLKTGFDKEYARFSPGELLNMYTSKRYFDMCVHEIDWLGDTNTSKQHWAPLVRHHVRYIVYPRSCVGYVLYAVDALLIPVIKQIISDMRSAFTRIRQSVRSHAARSAIPWIR